MIGVDWHDLAVLDLDHDLRQIDLAIRLIADRRIDTFEIALGDRIAHLIEQHKVAVAYDHATFNKSKGNHASLFSLLVDRLGGGQQDLKYHWTTDTTLYPDLAGLISSLHAKGVRFLGYFNPFILPKYDQWAEATTKGYTVSTADGKPYEVLITIYNGSMLDVTFPDAVAWFQGFARAAIVSRIGRH